MDIVRERDGAGGEHSTASFKSGSALPSDGFTQRPIIPMGEEGGGVGVKRDKAPCERIVLRPVMLGEPFLPPFLQGYDAQGRWIHSFGTQRRYQIEGGSLDPPMATEEEQADRHSQVRVCDTGWGARGRTSLWAL
jgi:hypothetical protein